MKSGETILQSPLDKPLGELTEEDISQLTREDCRKYLKEKGMRRPSWNKSQAIQQVLSLKALVERRTEDSGGVAGNRHKFLLPGPENEARNACPPSDPSNSPSADLPVPVSANESISYRRKESIWPDLTGDSSGIFPATGKGQFSLENNSISPSRAPETTSGTVAQMTIFYCGKVNVYEGVPSNKAQTIMQIAGTPNCTSYDALSAGDLSDRSVPCRFPVTYVRAGLLPPQPAEVSPRSQTEGPMSRKASLQRYLEKRKDRSRFKGRRKIVGSSSSSLEVYLNNPVRGQTPNRQSSRSGTCSPTRPRPPHTPVRCSSVENQAKNHSLSVDLNGDDVPEA